MHNVGSEIQYGLETLGTGKKKLNIKLLLIITLFLLCIVNIILTQKMAANFQYTKALGSVFFVYDWTPFYLPHKYWVWLSQLINKYGTSNTTVLQYLLIGIAANVAALVIPFLMMRAIRNFQTMKGRLKNLHGSAHWASKKEMIESGLLMPENSSKKAEGVYVGGYTDPSTNRILYLQHNGPEHILALAPTRSGKGVGLVLPTLLSWKHSAFVFDIKGENYALTAGWRKQHANNNILRFDPTDTTGDGARFNPLTEIRVGTKYEYADIDNLCLILADPNGSGGSGSDKYWVETSHSLLTGCVTHLLYKAKNAGVEPTLGDVYRLLTDPDQAFTVVLKEMLEYYHDPEKTQKWLTPGGELTATHPTVASKAREHLNRADKEASSVLSSATNAIKMFSDPILNRNVSKSTFRLKDLMRADKPTSLYVCITPANLARFSSLLRVLVTQITTILADELTFKDGRAEGVYKHRLLLMLDEFPALGAMPVFEKALAFISGYGLKAYLITQDIAQLQRVYTREESIISNTHLQIAYAPNKIETAEYLSKMLGQGTIIKKTRSKSVSKGVTTFSQSEQEQGRSLLNPDEVMRLRGPLKDANGNILTPGDMIIRVAGFAPIRGTQILYFKDPTFSRRSKMAAPTVSDIINES